MIDSANDEFFNTRRLLESLDEEQAIGLAFHLLDQNCGELDAEYWKKVIAAGTESQDVTRHSAALGSPAAQLILGTALLHGHFTEKAPAQGLFWLRRAHNNGNTKASIMLGGAYLEGTALPRDAGKAAGYIASAAQAGDPVGQYTYALLLIDGDGVAQDEDEAIRWLRQAAGRGYEKAMDMLKENSIPLREE